MPIKNLVSDFGGVGDGQRSTLLATITSGTGALSVGAGTGSFVSGDIGKAIAIWSGSNYYFGAITARSSADAITISPNITFALAAASSDILWGTDNTNAFTGVSGWRAYAITQTNPADIPILQIPDGNYCYQASASLHEGVFNDVKVTGLSGVAANCILMQLQNSEMRFGSNIAIGQKGLFNTGGNSVRLQTASSGSGTVTLSNPTGLDASGSTYGSRIVVGRACLIAAYDMQGLYHSDFGYPPNSYFYEWNTISGYNSGTGVVTLQTPLTQAYKSTYPQWGNDNTSSAADQGGPATLWVAPDGYDTTVTLENFTVDSPHNQSALHRRRWIANNLVMNGPGLYPTQNDVVTLNSCVYPQILEIDKMVGQVTWNSCTIRALQQQSASPNRMIVNGGTIQSLETAKYTEVNNAAFTSTADITLGVGGYGRTSRVVLNGCTGIATINRGGASTTDLFGSSGPGSQGNASDFYDFSTGVLRFLKTNNDGKGGVVGNSGQQNPTRLLVPGTWIFFDDKYLDQVQDVYEDGTYCYIRFNNTTAWPFTPVGRLSAHPCPDLTLTGCTGTADNLGDLQLAGSRKPAFSYSFRTYVGGPSSATVTPNNPKLLGRFVSETLTVTTPYVAAGTLSFNDSQFLNRNYAKRSDYSTSATFGSTINMKASGARVIRAATTATGAQTNDSLEDMTAPGEVNFLGNAAAGVVWSANVSNGETPTITVEYVMDQGIPPAVPTAVAPLRLRLRA